MKTPGSKSVNEDTYARAFAARYPKTSLLEWIGIIELGHRDALINLETQDGRKGRLWCVAGDIVDAQCGDLTGSEAVDEILSLEGGDFSITFDQIDRARSIDSTADAFLEDDAVETAQYRNVPHSDAPVAHSNRPERLREDRAQYVAIAASAAAMALGVWLYVAAPPSGNRAAATQVTQLTSKPPEPPMLVHVEVEPADAEISFDGKRVAVGHWHQAISHDGRTHEIRFSAPGYIPQRLFFLETAPSRRVTLERIVDSRADQGAPVNLEEQHLLAGLDQPRVAGSEQAQSNDVKRPRVHAEAGRAKRAPLSLPLLHRPAADSDPPSPLTYWHDVEAQKPRIQIIDPPEPRFQLVDSAKPKIQIIEPAKPKIRIIEPPKFKVRPLDDTSAVHLID